jgi:hypothetical protein
MSTRVVSLEDRQRWMRERQAAASTDPTPSPAGELFGEKHFTPAELGATWGLSPDAVRKLFESEPGVLVLGDSGGSRSKRRYKTLRIPTSVAARVHRRLANR